MKKLVAFLLISLAFVACTDYEADYEDTYGNLLVTYDEEESSSSEEADPESSQTDESSSSEEVEPDSLLGDESSSSKIASSSSGKNESSSSSNAESNSSKISSSSMKTAWDYLNPYISYGEMTDSRDGLVYKTVIICNQTWMAENLNYAYNEKTSSLDSSSFCYNNSTDFCSRYGRLYLWSAAMDSAAVFSDGGKGCGYGATCSASGIVRGVCPEGWHLPSAVEWNTLFVSVGGTSTANIMLKSTSGWDDGGEGEDSFGFSILPAGLRSDTGDFRNAGSYAYFWGSTGYSSYGAYFWNFSYCCESFDNHHNKDVGFAVRCVKNSDDEERVASSSSSKGETAWDYLNPNISYGEVTDSRDGLVYKTVIIGTQTWMAENLNYAYNEKTSSLDSSSFCYNNSADSCSKYGRLYLWSAAIDSTAVFSNNGKGCGYGTCCETSGDVRGVCPEGWHLPSAAEWDTLFTTVGGTRSASTMLKSTSGWNILNYEDPYGFAVLPAGIRDYDGYFEHVGFNAYFWSSQYNNSSAYFWDFGYTNANVTNDVSHKDYGFSVRCVRNFDGVASSWSSPNISYGEMIDSRDGLAYKTVTINSQTWMAENLNYAYNEKTTSLDSSSFCYKNSVDSCFKYGRLYLWSAAMDSSAVFSTDGEGCGYAATCSASGTVRGVCPEGWHLPSTDEWNSLFIAVGGTVIAGTVLKSTNGWFESGNGEDTYGFSVLPAGYRDSGFFTSGSSAYIWSSTESDSHSVYNLYFYYDNAYVRKNGNSKSFGFSVRCVKD